MIIKVNIKNFYYNKDRFSFILIPSFFFAYEKLSYAKIILFGITFLNLEIVLNIKLK